MGKLFISLLILAMAVTVPFSAIFHKPNIPNKPPQQNIPANPAKTDVATSSAKPETPKPKPVIEHPQATGRQVRVPILYYHYIANNPNPADKARDSLSVTPPRFEEQMDYLSKNGYTPITLDTMVAALKGQATLPAKPIVLTFDDGYQDLFTVAFPILQKYNFHAVAFIPTGLIGTKYYASWDQLKTMQDSGLISMQAHTVNHASLPSLSIERIRQEVVESKKTLEAKFGIPVNFIAYPYGTSNSLVWEEVKKAGYVGALGTWGSAIQSEGTIFDMPRIRQGGSMDIKTFGSRL